MSTPQEDAVVAATDLAVATAGFKVTNTGAGLLVGGFWLSNEFAVLLGLVCTVGGFAVTSIYRHRAHVKAQKRADEIHALRVERLHQRRSTDTDLAPLDLDALETDI